MILKDFKNLFGMQKIKERRKNRCIILPLVSLVRNRVLYPLIGV
jgi:hypothetical protein